MINDRIFTSYERRLQPYVSFGSTRKTFARTKVMKMGKEKLAIVMCFIQIAYGMNDVIITSYGQFWPWSVSETLSIIGRKHCTRECQARGSACLAVNYQTNNLQCEILQSVPSNLTELSDNFEYEYIEMASQTSVFSSSVCDSTCDSTEGHCIKLSSGLSYCRSTKIRCPINYRYSPALDFCYIEISTSADFQTAKSHCESIGARLAVLPTMEHINYIKSERTIGYLSSLRYTVGGEWDPVSGAWKWIDGSLIFGLIDRTLCRVNTDGGAIAWENKYLLMDTDPTVTNKFLCEKVLG